MCALCSTSSYFPPVSKWSNFFYVNGKNSHLCFELRPLSLSLPFYFSLHSKLLSTGQRFITDQNTFASWSSTIPTSASQTARARSLYTGQHTVRSPALHKLSAVYWYTLLRSHTLKWICHHHPASSSVNLHVFFFFSADVCVRLWRKQLPLSPYWTGRTMRGGRPCTLPLLTVTRQWWRCWRLTRAVTWQLMITSSERRCTGQLCSVGEHTSCMKPWMTATHGSFQLCGNVKFFPKQNEVEKFYTN